MKDLHDAVCHSDKFRLHPLGFFYLSGTTEQGLSRGVHVWLDDDTARRANECHLHSYDIVSWVVAGCCVVNCFYLIRPQTVPMLSSLFLTVQMSQSADRPVDVVFSRLWGLSRRLLGRVIG